MTTIAYARGVLASDSCWTGDDLHEASQTKIVRLSSGALLGGSGDNDSREVYSLLDKVRTSRQLPTRTQLAALRCSFSGLLILPNREIYKISADFGERHQDDSDYGIWQVGKRGIAAAGSGAHLAIGAMAAGKSAPEAVAIACVWDINSRMPIYSMELRPERKR